MAMKATAVCALDRKKARVLTSAYHVLLEGAEKQRDEEVPAADSAHIHYCIA